MAGLMSQKDVEEAVEASSVENIAFQILELERMLHEAQDKVAELQEINRLITGPFN